MHFLKPSNIFWKAPSKSTWVGVSQPLSSPQFSHNDSLWAEGITKSHRDQRLDYREGEEVSWCPSWSNSLWQEGNCGLAHFPAGNATDLIWRVLASSLGISSWTPLKPQRSILSDCLSSGNPFHVNHASAVKKRDHQMIVVGLALSSLLGSGRASMLSLWTLSLSWSLGHSNRSSFHRMSPDYQELQDLNWSAWTSLCCHDNNVFFSDRLWAPLG